MASNGTILIIDDDPVIKGVLFNMLRMAQYDVVEARSGEEGLRRVELNPPDVILLDVSLPGMDGYDVCRRLREDALTESTPIVFITAAEANVVEVQGGAAGGDYYVLKPFNAEDVAVDIYSLFAQGLDPKSASDYSFRVFRHVPRDVLHAPRELDLPVLPPAGAQHPSAASGTTQLEEPSLPEPVLAEEGPGTEIQSSELAEFGAALKQARWAMERLQRLLADLENRAR